MKTFLHVGCGPKHKDQTTRGFNTPDWTELRLDIDKNVNHDIVGTMLDMSAVADASVDAVFSSHNIEHLYPHEVPLARHPARLRFCHHCRQASRSSLLRSVGGGNKISAG